MKFPRKFSLEVITPGQIGQRFLMDRNFATPQQRDSYVLHAGSTFAANGTLFAYHDVEASFAGRLYRHYLQQATEIDDAIDYSRQHEADKFLPTKYGFDDGKNIKLFAQDYIVAPGICQFFGVENLESVAVHKRGARRKAVFECELSLLPSRDSVQSRQMGIFGAEKFKGSVDGRDGHLAINELIFEDNSKLFVINRDNESIQVCPFQVSIVFWDGKGYR
jgi:hypothetical protein